MALSDNYVPTKESGTGSKTIFTGTWNPLSAAFIRIYLEDKTTGVQTLQTQGADYTFTFTNSGWTATFVTAPATTVFVVGARVTTQEQQTVYKTARGFQGPVQEGSYDRLTAMVQELQDAVDRSLQFQVGSTVSTELPPLTGNAGRVVAVTSSEDGFEYLLLSSGSSFVNTFDQDVFNGTGAQLAFTTTFSAAGQNTILVWVDGIRQRPGTDYTYSGTTLTFTTAPAAGSENVVVLNLTTDVAASTPTDGSVTTAKIADDAVTFAKMQEIADNRVVGNTSGATANPSEVVIHDEDDMASDDENALASQQSIKAYVDANRQFIMQFPASSTVSGTNIFYQSGGNTSSDISQLNTPVPFNMKVTKMQAYVNGGPSPGTLNIALARDATGLGGSLNFSSGSAEGKSDTTEHTFTAGQRIGIILNATSGVSSCWAHVTLTCEPM